MRLFGPAAAVLAAGALVLAGCGSNAHDPLAPQRAFRKADQRTAGMVDVQQSDVPPEYRPQGSQETGHEKCAADLGGLTLTGADVSRPFVTRAPSSYVIGRVDVFRSAGQAATAFRRVTGARRRGCLLQLGRSALAGYDHGRLTVAPIQLTPASPGRTTLARRFTGSWREPTGTHVQTTDDVYLLAGRTFVILSFFRDRGVFTPVAEARVVARVAARAAAGARITGPTHPGGNTTRGE